MGLLFINQCALVWPGLWPIFNILQLWVLNVLMVGLYQQMMKGNEMLHTGTCVCAHVCVWRCVYCMSEAGIVEPE